ncbi:nicotinate (nicotinamide) nucleotide adenylyltransferase [Silvibacterium acidisoli]|uniref:nicotinate (nicotinamide) nucleotide adenylyltransferase n=1 Tax=Acidobacteriaceae bacterium ZG23-2 TaxID=2883246 RepID=UPI00406CF258
MRIGIFGGTFDPPHRGHVALARIARERLRLDRVLIAPVGSQPLKTGVSHSSFEDRVAMAQLAFAGESHTEISLIDAPRPDGHPNYTFDTIQRLQREGSAGDLFFCILGADSFLSVAKWHRAADLLVLCDFIVGARPGFDLGRLTAALPDSIALANESGSDGLMVVGLRRQDGCKSRLYLLPDLAEDISATEIRGAVGDGINKNGTTGAVLSPSVLNYIESHALYRQG